MAGGAARVERGARVRVALARGAAWGGYTPLASADVLAPPPPGQPDSVLVNDKPCAYNTGARVVHVNDRGV